MPSQINPAVGVAPAASTQKSGNPNATLDKDDFLKLFVAQMQHQDPSKPMDDTAMMGQMASFSTLEQISNMATANTRVADSLSQSHAIGLIGRTVSYLDAAGASRAGLVEKVSTVDGRSVLTVDGVDGVDPGTVVQVS
jgi:flagellar basal-body rod modification protein FlgD